MRTFTASAAFTYGTAWSDALGAPGHIRQFPTLLVAKTKKAGVEMLVEMGLSEGSAQRLVAELRLTDTLGRDWAVPVVDGAIDLDVPALYLSQGARKGSTVVRVTGGDSAQAVGAFDYEARTGLRFVRA